MERKVSYTEAAERKMVEILDRHKRDLEQYVIRRKLVPGDEFVEVTASELEDAARHVSIRDPRSTQLRTTIFRLYTFMGVVMTGAGLFYDRFRQMDPFQLMLVVMGVSVTLAGIYGSSILARREKEP